MRALLVIDVQNEYFSGKLPVVYPAGSMDNILLAMDTAAATNFPVVVIQHSSPAADAPVFCKGSLEWQLHPQIASRPCDVVIEKNWPDSFCQTALDGWLRGKGVDTLSICGYMTQVCCDTTARRACHLGYRVEFLADATGTLAFTNAAGSISAEELHRAILVVQQSRFSSVLATSDWIDRLAR